MTPAGIIGEALSLYKKHGWTLRRVLLSEKSREQLEDQLGELFGAVEVVNFEKDAAWFSRPSGTDREAWELRLFGDAPFALVEVFADDEDEETREALRCEAEERLLGTDPVKPAVKP